MSSGKIVQIIGAVIVNTNNWVIIKSRDTLIFYSSVLVIVRFGLTASV